MDRFTITSMGVGELLERTIELRQLSALFAAACSGRGQVCFIEGPSGVGKSRLLDECAGTAQALGMRVLRARCSELTRDYPFGVARNLFEATVVRAEPETRAKLMQGSAALAAPVFGQGEASDVFGVVHGLYWLTVNLAEERPTTILVDDLPWADDFSLRFFAYLAERLDDEPVAFVVAVRSGDPGAESELLTHLRDAVTSPPIRPADLSEDAVGALLSRALPGDNVDTSVARAVVGQTGGNPFLVVAVAEAVRTGEDPELTTPESVRCRIARRLARLEGAARQLVKAAAVLGDDSALHDGIRLAGLQHGQGLVAGEELCSAEVFESADPIMFAHRIVRMAIYGLLAPAERVALHAQAAQLLAANNVQPEVIAEHLLMAGPPHEAWALAVLHDAGCAASRKGASAAALRYLRHALDVADHGEVPPRLLVDLGLAEAAAGEPMSMGRFERALDLIYESDERADALYSLGETLYRFGRYAEAGVAFRRGAELLEGGDKQTRLTFQGAAWSAESHLAPTGPGPEAIAVTDDGPGTRAILAVQALRGAVATPPAAPAADLAIRALGGGALLAEQGSQGPSVNLAVLALLHCGRVVEAHHAADATVRDARMRGAQLAYAEATIVRALVLHTRGQITEAAADAQAAVDILQHSGNSHAQTALAVLVNCMIERGELTEASSVLDHADEQLESMPAINAYVRLARGRMYLQRRMFEAARRDCEAAGDAFREFGTVNPSVLPWRSLAGLIAHHSGDETGGHGLIQEEVSLARAFEVPIPLGLALQRRALTETGDHALSTFQEAVSILKETEAKLHLARAHAGLGRGLRLAGHRIDARRQLEIGLDLAHRCGATGVVAEIREELKTAGARPRRPSVTGVESLTPTELRVAGLAAEGNSNREIAEQTFVSRNTVAWHLRNIYRKLQVESREQLPIRIET
jgi:DNA-binding CsgD family transcriptional regulator